MLGWVAIYLKSNELLKKQIFINDWVIDVFLTKSEKAYIYRKGRMIERMGARIATKFAYRFFLLMLTTKSFTLEMIVKSVHPLQKMI